MKMYAYHVKHLMFCFGLFLSCASHCLEIRVDPKTSAYPLAVSLSTLDGNPVDQYFIKNDKRSTTITLADILNALDDAKVKAGVKTSNMVHVKIKYATSGDATEADILLYEGDVALDAVITVVTSSFGSFQTIGAVKIKPRKGAESYEPGLKSYKYVEGIALKKISL